MARVRQLILIQLHQFLLEQAVGVFEKELISVTFPFQLIFDIFHLLVGNLMFECISQVAALAEWFISECDDVFVVYRE